ERWVRKICCGTARNRQACGCGQRSARLNVQGGGGSEYTLRGLQAGWVVAPAKTIKTGNTFSAHPLDIERLQEAMKIPGCLYGDVCRLTNLKPLRPAEQCFGLEQQDGEREPGHHGGELWERVVSGSTHGVGTGNR
ncbi:MAG: hypothetical protein ABSG62_16035, partial [Terracidiphilus sp.]